MDYPKTVPNVALSGGKFTDGDPASGTPASLVPAEWLNSVTDELLNVLAEANINPDEASNTQVRDAILAIIAAQFSGTNQSLGASGYQKLPGGLIFQWGTFPSFAHQTIISVTFPITFPNNAVMGIANTYDGGTAATYRVNAENPGLNSMTITNTLTSGSVPAGGWLALGY